MYKRAVFYLTHNGDRKRDWALRERGNDAIIASSSNKQNLLHRAVGIAKKEKLSQIIIQDRHGDWQEERTYGRDSFPPRG